MEKEKQNSKECYFCVNQIDYIDYKDIDQLHKYINTYKKIFPRKKTGTCAWHQRKLADAIKRARIMALLPFIRK